MPASSPDNTIFADDQKWRIDLKIMPIDVEARQKSFSARRELVTITVSKEDYAKLKAVGGPHPSHIDMALRHYLNLVKETPQYLLVDNPGWRRGPVVSFLCAIQKHLSDDIRSLSGRFDSHTIQAFHLFFL